MTTLLFLNLNEALRRREVEWSGAAESVPGKVCQGRRPTEGKCSAARSDWGDREREREREREGGGGSWASGDRPTDSDRPSLSHLISPWLSVPHNREFSPLGISFSKRSLVNAYPILNLPMTDVHILSSKIRLLHLWSHMRPAAWLAPNLPKRSPGQTLFGV